jgi:hypothetical protein
MIRNAIKVATVAALVLGAVAVGTTKPASANDGGAFIAGLVGGAILGGVAAQAQQPRQHRGQVYYYDQPRFVSPPPVVYYERPVRCRRVIVEDDYGNEYVRRVCR